MTVPQTLANGAAAARHLNTQHDGVGDLARLMIMPEEADRQEYERALRRLGESLVWRADIDPIFKHDFLLLLEAASLYRATSAEPLTPGVKELVEQCFRTYRAVRQAALHEGASICGVAWAAHCADYDRFAALTRLERLGVQATLIRNNAAEMAQVSTFLLQAVPLGASRILNAGDGAPFQKSFLRRLTTYLQGHGRRADIVSIDVSPVIFRLQRDVVTTAAAGDSTFAFHQMDACATWFADHVFDCALASFMIDDCRDHAALLRELARVVKRGGIVCVSGHHLAQNVVADDFVHNFGDVHGRFGHPVMSADIARLVQDLPLRICERIELPHAWGLLLAS